MFSLLIITNARVSVALAGTSQPAKSNPGGFALILRHVGRRGAFRGRNSGERFHGGNDPAPRRVRRQCGGDGSARLRNALCVDAVAPTSSDRRVRGIYWDVFSL